MPVRKTAKKAKKIADSSSDEAFDDDVFIRTPAKRARLPAVMVDSSASQALSAYLLYWSYTLYYGLNPCVESKQNLFYFYRSLSKKSLPCLCYARSASVSPGW